MKLLVPVKPVESIVFKSDVACIATFRCPVENELFENSGPASNHLFVFPRTSTIIQHQGQQPIVSGPNLVMFYNQYDLYSRKKLSAEGDSCDWFVVSDQLLEEIVGRHDPAVVDRPGHPFTFTSVPSDPLTYLAQRRLFHYAARSKAPDRLLVEESVLDLLGTLVARAHGGTQAHQKSGSKRSNRSRNRETVERAREFLAGHFLEALSLGEVAANAGSSMFHLCRQFRRITGLSIHQYRQRLRLFHALERLDNGTTDLTELALDLGYSSHSHFTFTFRRTFGISPSDYRQRKPLARAS